jgi:hypothetical protein
MRQCVGSHVPNHRSVLRFTPAEWRQLLEDKAFLHEAGNSYWPRRFMDVPVEIIPDHWTGVISPRPRAFPVQTESFEPDKKAPNPRFRA